RSAHFHLRGIALTNERLCMMTRCELNAIHFAFHTYRKVASVAVATFRPALRVARFNADLTFSLLSTNPAKGILSATPPATWARSDRILLTTCLCFPLRPWGTSSCAMVLKFIGALW